MFPASWRQAPISISAEPISQRQKNRGILEVNKAMVRYPAKLLKSNLVCVYLVSKLRCNNIYAGGTNSRHRVYLCVGSRYAG